MLQFEDIHKLRVHELDEIAGSSIYNVQTTTNISKATAALFTFVTLSKAIQR